MNFEIDKDLFDLLLDKKITKLTGAHMIPVYYIETINRLIDMEYITVHDMDIRQSHYGNFEFIEGIFYITDTGEEYYKNLRDFNEL